MSKREDQRAVKRSSLLDAIRSEQARCGRACGYPCDYAHKAGMSITQAIAMLYAMQRDGLVKRVGWPGFASDAWEIVGE